MSKLPTVTVVTSSIGRPELKRCMASVTRQTFKCHHLIFINGERWFNSAKDILASESKYFNVHYLAEETGNLGRSPPGCGAVFAAAPFLTNSDYIFFLNDDDFYDPGHVETLVNIMAKNDCDWGYSLRRFVNADGSIIGEDDYASLGFWPSPAPNPDGTKDYLIDNSCFALKNQVARDFGKYWLEPHQGDRMLLWQLMQNQTKGACSGITTVNYQINDQAYLPKNFRSMVPLANAESVARFNGNAPWRQGPRVFTFKKVFDPKLVQGTEVMNA